MGNCITTTCKAAMGRFENPTELVWSKSPCPDNDPTKQGQTRTVISNSLTSGSLLSPKNIKRDTIPPQILCKRTKNIKCKFSIGKEIGRGTFGTTFLCWRHSTGKQYACKTMTKLNIHINNSVDDVRREAQIMRHLRGKPHIVNLKRVYEDRDAVHLVMDLCWGGELFARISNKHHYSERDASRLFRIIVKSIHTCHSNGVIHRDIKPENFLLAKTDDESSLKLTDFGLSVMYKPGQRFTDRVGSAYYIAPEVLRRRYGPECDVWSAGVILHILLSGRLPFQESTVEYTFAAITTRPVDLNTGIWKSISDSAKDLVTKMLHKDPKKRISAYDALSHPWLREDSDSPNTPIDESVLNGMRQFVVMNDFKKLALNIVAKALSTDEIEELKKTFEALDIDGNRTISLQELRDGLLRQNSKIKDEEVKSLMDAADLDKSGDIDYHEFIAATMNLRRLKEEYLRAAFKYFDKDKNGLITTDEMEHALKSHGMFTDENAKKIMKEVDTNKDGCISYEEFATMMKNNLPAYKAPTNS